jgi:hypothetical protein
MGHIMANFPLRIGNKKALEIQYICNTLAELKLLHFPGKRKNLKNGQNFTPFWVNKMFSHKF